MRLDMGHLRGVDPDAEPDPGPGGTSLEDRRFVVERMLMEADRMMIQIVNLSVSLIGFGFSINAFFNDAAMRAEMGSGHGARLFGISLVLLGLLFLSMGVWTQARYRRKLMVRYGEPAGFRAPLDGRVTPAFVTALLLLMSGVGALSIMLFRRLL
jgi:uncharacterized membrane protein YidH (DUF202 family)